jgi:hypothetical protein
VGCGRGSSVLDARGRLSLFEKVVKLFLRFPRDHREKSSPGRANHDANSSYAVLTSVWVSHPLHPFYAQEVAVLGPITSSAGPALRVRYPDGNTAPLLREWASSTPIRAVPTAARRCPISLAGLRELAALLEARSTLSRTAPPGRAASAAQAGIKSSQEESASRTREGRGSAGGRGQHGQHPRARRAGGKTGTPGTAGDDS